MRSLLLDALLKGPAVDRGRRQPGAPALDELAQRAGRAGAAAARPLAVDPRGRRRLLQRLRAGDPRAQQSRLRRRALRAEVRRLAAPCRRAAGDRPRDLEHAPRRCERTYAATPEPKWVVAVGDCAANCGVFAGSSPSSGRCRRSSPSTSPSPAARQPRSRCSKDCWRSSKWFEQSRMIFALRAKRGQPRCPAAGSVPQTPSLFRRPLSWIAASTRAQIAMRVRRHPDAGRSCNERTGPGRDPGHVEVAICRVISALGPGLFPRPRSHACSAPGRRNDNGKMCCSECIRLHAVRECAPTPPPPASGCRTGTPRTGGRRASSDRAAIARSRRSARGASRRDRARG